MPSWGCLHLRSEWFLWSKENTRPPASFTTAHGPCNTQCYMCNNEYQKYMLPIVYEGAVLSLATEYFKVELAKSSPIDFSKVEALPAILSKSADLRKMVFGIKTASGYNIHVFFFQLVASKILEFEWTNNQKEIICGLSRDTNGAYAYEDISSGAASCFVVCVMAGPRCHMIS